MQAGGAPVMDGARYRSMREALVAVTLCACSSPPAPPQAPLSHHEASALLSYCVERETPCETGAHTELVNGKLVTVIGGGLDCVGPRHVECTFADGRRAAIPGEATDVVGLGGGRYRYLAWDGDRPTLVTVAHGQSTRVAGGAARTYGPFGPYGLTAQSRDGRIAATPVEDPDDETVSAIVVRDTTRDAELARIALRPPIKRDRGLHVLLSHDGVRAGLCFRSTNGLALQLADRALQLPGTHCVAADAELAQVIVNVAIDGLAVVDLASGRRTALAARHAAFAGRDAVLMVVHRGAFRRGRADDTPPELVYEQLATQRLTSLGNVPFSVDDLRVTADGRAAIVFHEKTGDDPPRALAVRLPDGRPYELAIPKDTVDLTIVAD